MPSVGTYFRGVTHMALVDLDKATEFHLSVNVVVKGSAASILWMGAHRPGDDITLYALNASGAVVLIDTTGVHDSGWVAIDPGSRLAGMRLSVHGSKGNGATDPQFNMIFMEYR